MSAQENYNKYLSWQTPEYNQTYCFDWVVMNIKQFIRTNSLFDAAMIATYWGEMVGLVPDYESFKLI